MISLIEENVGDPFRLHPLAWAVILPSTRS
jgi:hypothetical protein